ncbi:MAG: hypothetical protein JWO63_1821 [Frankiales bacterium]|nr:hypothetical protein [Frankiales bacterium]
MSNWQNHPAVRTGARLTLGERAADKVRNGMGSWPFVGSFLGIMGVWAILNSVFYLGGTAGHHGFDPYPYILLNLMLSMVAGLQGAILLIAAKRADQVSSEVALHTLDNTAKLTDLLEQNTALTRQMAKLTDAIHAHVCLGPPEVAAAASFPK